MPCLKYIFRSRAAYSTTLRGPYRRTSAPAQIFLHAFVDGPIRHLLLDEHLDGLLPRVEPRLGRAQDFSPTGRGSSASAALGLQPRGAAASRSAAVSLKSPYSLSAGVEDSSRPMSSKAASTTPRGAPLAWFIPASAQALLHAVVDIMQVARLHEGELPSPM